LKGSVTIGESQEKYEAHNTLILSTTEQQTGVAITAHEDGTELVLVCISASAV
jgi:hypothetical protein